MAGYILQQFAGRGAGRQYEGFVFIFLLAIASRMASVLFVEEIRARLFSPARG